MKRLLLLVIKLYWAMVPARKRRTCIFRTSCSRYVYEVTGKEGLFQGLKALLFRFQNCRAGYHVFEHSADGTKVMLLPGGGMVPENEMAERFTIS